MIDISFVIPVYNIAIRDLKRCLASILKLSKSLTIEIIVVDDGSDEFIEEFFKQYNQSNIKYIKKENGGVSSARNLGINKALGRYLAFVDADDEIIPSAYEDFVTVSEYDLIVFDLLVIENKKEYIWKSIEKYDENDKLSIYKTIAVSNSFNSPCAKLFKKSIIDEHNLCFDIDMITGEDLNFVIDFIERSSNYIYIQNSAYKYYRDEASRINRLKKYPDRYYENCEYLYTRIKKILLENNMSDTYYVKFQRDRIDSIFNFAADFLSMNMLTYDRKEKINESVREINGLKLSFTQGIKARLLKKNRYFTIKCIAIIRMIYLKLK